jgi:hypothetical protein
MNCRYEGVDEMCEYIGDCQYNPDDDPKCMVCWGYDEEFEYYIEQHYEGWLFFPPFFPPFNGGKEC